MVDMVSIPFPPPLPAVETIVRSSEWPSLYRGSSFFPSFFFSVHLGLRCGNFGALWRHRMGKPVRGINDRARSSIAVLISSSIHFPFVRFSSSCGGTSAEESPCK